MPDARSTRLAQFTQWPLHWVVVRHFLSADLMEELSRALVSVASNGVLSFDALFESVQSAGPSALTCFILRPTPIDEPFGRCLQEVVRTIVWQSDQTVSFSDQGIKKEDAEFLREINIALTLSAIDFEAISSGSFRTASVANPLQSLCTAMTRLCDFSEPTERPVIEEILHTATSGVASPLSALISKHLGDLCADRDRWNDAVTLYDHAEKMLSDKEPAWLGLVSAVRTIVAQSISAAYLASNGPEAALSNPATAVGKEPDGPNCLSQRSP